MSALRPRSRRAPALRIVVALVLAACAPSASERSEGTAGGETPARPTGPDPAPGDAGAPTAPTPLEAPFSGIDRACATAADCVLVQHVEDCCGTARSLGIAVPARAAFDALEAAHLRAHPPMCECVARQLDDTGAPYVGSLALTCLAGECRTLVLP